MSLLRATAAKSDGHAARVNEEIKFSSAQKGNPIKPLYFSRNAGRVNDTRRKARWRECDAATTGVTTRVVNIPSRSIKGF
jgi:hypothetical protein